MKKLICSFLCLLVVLYSFPVSVFGFSMTNSDTVGSFEFPDTSVMYIKSKQLNYNQFLFYNPSDNTYYYIAVEDHSTDTDAYQVLTNGNTFYAIIAKLGGMTTYQYNRSYAYYSYNPDNNSDWVGSYESNHSGAVSYDTSGWLLISFDVINHFYDDVTGNEHLLSRYRYSDSPFNLSYISDVSSIYSWNNDGTINTGSDEPSEPGSVDLTATNNLISSLGDKLDDLSDKVILGNSVLSSISTKVNTIQSDLAAVKSSVATIATSVSEGGYIASRINTIQSDIAAIKTNTGNLNSTLGDSGYIGSRVNTISDNLTQLITVLITKLDLIISNLSLINEDLTRPTNSEPVTTLFKTLGDFYSSFNSFCTYMTNDFIDMWVAGISSILDAMTTFYNTTFPAFISTMNTRFEELYNVIIYGDKNGGQAIQNEKQQVEEFSADLNEVSTHLDDASTVIDGASAGVASYIQTFTDFYNGFTALNAGLSAVFLFALVFIFVKKAIGR